MALGAQMAEKYYQFRLHFGEVFFGELRCCYNLMENRDEPGVDLMGWEQIIEPPHNPD